MSCFKLTKRNNKDLDKINRKFIWIPNIVPNETKGIPLVAWDVIYRPKFEGGLGIRKNKDVNKNSITKLGWRARIDNDSI